MTKQPRTVDDIYENLRDSLTGKIAKLTNFTERSFNYVFTRAVSNYLREVEVEVLATELSGYIDYAGGPITDEDLRRLGVADSVSPEAVNEYMSDEDLDDLVALVGVERDEGTRSTGFVDLFTDQDSRVEIPTDMKLSTEPDSSGSVLTFTVDSDEEIVSPEGSSLLVDVPVIAEERGTEYNVPGNSLVTIPSPPVGVRGIDSSTAMTGGEDREPNDELRERAKASLTDTPDGGTVRGIVSNIYKNIDAVEEEEIGVTERFDREPVVVEVTVDGGNETDINEQIEDGRPVGVKHQLLRPETIFLSVDVKVLGEDVDITFVENELLSYLVDELNVGDDFFYRQLIREIMEADSGILNIDSLSVNVDRVEEERFRFDTDTSQYRLLYTHDGDSITVVDSDENVFVQGTDYQVIDTTADGRLDTIEWLGVDEPNAGEDFFVDYTVSDDIRIRRDETYTHNTTQSDTFTQESDRDEYGLTYVPFDETVTIDGFTQRTDFELTTQSIERERDEFTYSGGKSRYTLNKSVLNGDTSVFIPNSTAFSQGTDYELDDTDGDGLDDTIVWLDGESPNDGELFAVEYDVDNGLKQTVRWLDSGSEPATGDTFTVEYERGVYTLDNEIKSETEQTIVVSDGGSQFSYQTDFRFVDSDADNEKEALEWLSGGSRPSDGTDFYATYLTEGDISIDERQKIDPEFVTVTEV